MRWARNGKTANTDAGVLLDKNVFRLWAGRLSVVWARNPYSRAESDALSGRCTECRARLPKHYHGCSHLGSAGDHGNAL